MRDLFRFLNDFMDSFFGGWRGRLGLCALMSALILLALWGHEHVPRGVLEGYTLRRWWEWWGSIIPLTFVAAALLLTNLRKPPQ